MIRILSCSADTYITNKVINNSFRATDSNTGNAGTVDIFSLFNESTLPGSASSNIYEISRALIKFDLTPLRKLTGSILDITNPTFKCTLQMKDIYGGQPTPTNFKLILFPLSQTFDEGIGRDLYSFSDIDTSNFITASTLNGTSLWYVTGADAQGFLGSSNIDIIGSGTLNGSTVLLWTEQSFPQGNEDLSMDITQIVSATLSGLIPDCGFRLGFSGSQESDGRTKFVKRFASRHSTNTRITPRIYAQFDDSLLDDHDNFYFDASGSLFLSNAYRGINSNIVSGSALAAVTGLNSVILTLTSGSYSKIITGSQHKIGAAFVTGVYSASFAIPSNATASIVKEIVSAGSATFTEVWGSLDGTVGYHTGTLVVYGADKSTFSSFRSAVSISLLGMRNSYKAAEKIRFRVYAVDDSNLRISRKFLDRDSLIFRDSYYQVRDAYSGDVVIPFDTTTYSTRMSTDSSGMYFDLYMDCLPAGRAYQFDIFVNDRGISNIYKMTGNIFRVDP